MILLAKRKKERKICLAPSALVNELQDIIIYFIAFMEMDIVKAIIFQILWSIRDQGLLYCINESEPMQVIQSFLSM